MTSSTSIKLTGFAAGLAVLFGGAAIAGGAIDPDRGGQDAPEEEHGNMSASPHTTAADPVRGLAVAQDGLRLVVDDTELRRGSTENLRLRVVGAGGAAVRDFDVEHEKRMHVIVVRRDLTGFQHLHPKMAGDGTWTTPLRLDDAGSYRVFADFSHDGEAQTLAADLRVDGDADLNGLPEPSALAKSDGGYDVRLDDEDGELRFTITRDGSAIEAEPYLGARGHLVALREGDLAFLHVHPHDDSVAFEAEFPTPGRYRLFLQFKHEGRVQTVGFTREVAR